MLSFYTTFNRVLSNPSAWLNFAWVYVYASNTQEFDSENAIKDMRKQGYGSLLYTMVESFIRDVYKSEKIGISLVKDTLSVSDFYNAKILFFELLSTAQDHKLVHLTSHLTIFRSSHFSTNSNTLELLDPLHLSNVQKTSSTRRWTECWAWPKTQWNERGESSYEQKRF